MTVKELKEELNKYPDHLRIVVSSNRSDHLPLDGVTTAIYEPEDNFVIDEVDEHEASDTAYKVLALWPDLTM